MFIKYHERMKEHEGGFTLIELLVVILIIAILAAIAIPVFLNQRKKGWRAQVQSALKNASTAEESYATENNGQYTTSPSDLVAQGYSTVANVTLVSPITLPTTGVNAGGYCIVAQHALLAGSSDTWATAIYQSHIGQPEATDTCTT